jgi:hypothetical protein
MSSVGNVVLCSAQHAEDTERKPAGMLQTGDIVHGNKRVAEYWSLGAGGIGETNKWLRLCVDHVRCRHTLTSQN